MWIPAYAGMTAWFDFPGLFARLTLRAARRAFNALRTFVHPLVCKRYLLDPGLRRDDVKKNRGRKKPGQRTIVSNISEKYSLTQFSVRYNRSY